MLHHQGYISQPPQGSYNNPYAAPPNVPAHESVVLDDYNSDLNFVIEADGVTGGSRHEEGFEYLWAGARATHGVRSGKAAFEVQVLNKLPVSMPETESTPHVMRVGWSTDLSSFQVGEDTLSYGYGGTGKCSVNNKYFNYGEPYTTNDVITCYVDLDATPKAILFAKNGKFLNVAFRIGSELDGQELYPHITMKNMRFTANFGKVTPYFPLIQGFSLLECLQSHSLVRGSAGPSTRQECEIIMMVGLPAAGKSVWAANYAKNHKEKKYNILGTNIVMDRMKVMGLMRKRNYHGRWDALIKQATGILNQVFKIAERKNRNYILDQTNVYPNARRRKMNSFRGYHRISAVIVTTNEMLKQRTEKREREEGKLVPESAIMEMKSNFTLPEVGEIFDKVWFLEQDKTSSEQLIKEFRQQVLAFKDSEKKRKADEKQSVTQSSASAPNLKKPRAQVSPASQTPLPQQRYGQHESNDPCNTASHSAHPPPGVYGAHAAGPGAGGYGYYAAPQGPTPVQNDSPTSYGQLRSCGPSEHDDACVHTAQDPYDYGRSWQERGSDQSLSSSSYQTQPAPLAQNRYDPPSGGTASGWYTGSAIQGHDYQHQSSSGHQTEQSHATQRQGYPGQSSSGHQTEQSHATQRQGYSGQSYSGHQTEQSHATQRQGYPGQSYSGHQTDQSHATQRQGYPGQSSSGHQTEQSHATQRQGYPGQSSSGHQTEQSHATQRQGYSGQSSSGHHEAPYGGYSQNYNNAHHGPRGGGYRQ